MIKKCVSKWMLQISIGLLAALFILEGIATAIGPTGNFGSFGGFLFEYRTTLVALGVLFAGIGVALLWGMIKKRRKLTERALVVAYLTGLFTAVVEVVITGSTLNILDNIIIILAAAGMWLWWRLNTLYMRPKDMAVLDELLDNHPPA